jgi:hypothetical protein
MVMYQVAYDKAVAFRAEAEAQMKNYPVRSPIWKLLARDKMKAVGAMHTAQDAMDATMLEDNGL